MDLSFGPQYGEFRAGVRSFLDDNRSVAPPSGMGEGDTTGQNKAWQQRLIEAGYAARTIPCEYGGFGAAPDLLETIIIDEEFRRAKVAGPMANQGISMLVPTLLEYGSEAQKLEYVASTIRGDLVWCQGYSEPGAGSDLASLRTSAMEDGDELVINGHKIWTSTARESQMMFALVRTDPEASKHAGISYVLVPTDSAGLDIRPLRMMTGSYAFNEVFFDNVRIPKANMVGRPGQGWEIGTATLFHERNMLGAASQTETMFVNMLEVAAESGALLDPAFRDRVAAVQARILAMKYQGLRLLTDRVKKRGSGIAGLLTKLNGCQLNHDVSAMAIDAMGERGILAKASPHVRDHGLWQAQYMFTLGLIIGGGTAQVQKNIISERGLGMPREPKVVPKG